MEEFGENGLFYRIHSATQGKLDSELCQGYTYVEVLEVNSFVKLIIMLLLTFSFFVNEELS